MDVFHRVYLPAWDAVAHRPEHRAAPPLGAGPLVSEELLQLLPERPGLFETDPELQVEALLLGPERDRPAFLHEVPEGLVRLAEVVEMGIKKGPRFGPRVGAVLTGRPGPPLHGGRST